MTPSHFYHDAVTGTTFCGGSNTPDILSEIHARREAFKSLKVETAQREFLLRVNRKLFARLNFVMRRMSQPERIQLIKSRLFENNQFPPIGGNGETTGENPESEK